MQIIKKITKILEKQLLECQNYKSYKTIYDHGKW